MTKFTALLFVAASTLCAQAFQPPSWSQAQSQSQSQSQSTNEKTVQQRLEAMRSQLVRQQLSRAPIEAQSGPVAGHPVSGKEVRHSSQTLMDGTVIDRGADISYFFRDSSGRMRAESPNRVEVFDNVGNVEYDMNPAAKTYRKSALSGREKFIAVAVFGGTSYTNTSTDANHAAESPGGSSEDLGMQTINGVMAKGTRVTMKIPPGTIGNNREIKVVNERWYSEGLQLLIKSINNDPRFGVNSYELTEIKQTSPDPALFVPPPDYTQVSREQHK